MEEIQGPGDVLSVRPHQLEEAKKTFFFQKEDGTYFADSGNNADITAKKFKFVGSSDGKTFRDIMSSGRKQSMSREDAQALIQKAFDAELEVALGNKSSELPKHNNGYGNKIPDYLKGLIK